MSTIIDMEPVVLIRTARDLGLLVRERRRELGWTQLELAERVGVTRQWVSGLESGKRGTELGKVLDAISILDLRVDLLAPGEVPPSPAFRFPEPVDLDAHIARLREG